MARASGKNGIRRGGRPKRRSLENPNVPLNIHDPDDDTLSLFGAQKSASGVRVSMNKALGYPAVWRAVSLIAGDVAKLPLLTYKLVGGDHDNRAVDRSHYSYRLLRYKAHADLLSYHLKQVLTFHVLTKGNGYGFIDRKGAKPVGLLILDPDHCEPGYMPDGLYYKYDVPGMKPRLIPSADVLHIRGLGYDGLKGYPVLQIMRDSLGAAIAARDHSAKYFKNGARPGGMIKTPNKLKPEARRNMRESWERLHKGLDNAHKVAILEEGCEFVAFTGDARNAQLLESREFDAREIANIFGVPTHKLGDPSKVAYNSLGEENQSYYDDTLSRWLQLWSDECSDKLLSEKEKESESHCIDFDYSELKRANLAALTAFGTAAVSKWATIDEVRALFGWNPLPGGAGAKFVQDVSPPSGLPGRSRRANRKGAAA